MASTKASSTESDWTNAQRHCCGHSLRDFNGYGYFTGLGLRANNVEKYVFVKRLLHGAVALKRRRVDLRSAGLS